ncbi:MAG: hypothetical protein ABSD20_09490 [Terriglobales bacterium]
MNGTRSMVRPEVIPAVVVPIRDASANERLPQEKLVPFPVSEEKDVIADCRTDLVPLAAPGVLNRGGRCELGTIPAPVGMVDAQFAHIQVEAAEIAAANPPVGITDRRSGGCHPLLLRFGEEDQPKLDAWGRLLAAEMDQLQSEQAGRFAELRPRLRDFIAHDLKAKLAGIGNRLALRQPGLRYKLAAGVTLGLLLWGLSWWEKIVH